MSTEQAPAEISAAMQTLADYIVRAGDTALPDNVTEKTKHHLLDTLASMVSGSRLPPGIAALRYIQAQGGTKEALIPGSRIVTTVVNAALAGGMLAHADETDDSHAPSLAHPGCAIVPAALAMGEREGSSGTKLLRAVALGYDVSSRMSPALGGYALSAAGRDTHAHGTIFGAAAACGSLARLTAEQVRHLISYTSQQAAGLSNYARDTEHIEKAFIFAGMPARNGAAAATMVASGMTGIDDAFSGDRNLFFAFAPHAKPELATRGLGEAYEILNTNIKRWTVGSPIQAPLDSLYALFHQHRFKAEDVEKVVVRVSQQGARTTNNRHMPDINMQYMVAVMLIDRTATLEAAHDIDRMNDPKVLELRGRVELLGDDALQAALPIRQGIVDITLKNGKTLHHHTQNVRGTPQNPMPREEVEDKAYRLLRPVIRPKRAKALIDAIWNIERVGNVQELRPLLKA